jgi:hypothetical protein
MSGRLEPPVGRREAQQHWGLSGRPLVTAAEPIVRILKREDFEDHWQVLIPDGVSDLGLGRA